MNEVVQDILRATWPQWELVQHEPIGYGSYSHVYQAKNEAKLFGSPYAAIKVIETPTPDDVLAMEADGCTADEINTFSKSQAHNYTQEIQLMEKVKHHPNFVAIEDYALVERESHGVNKWYILIRMEYLTPLKVYRTDDRLEDVVIRLGIQMCTALNVCREHRIVHRDIKPGNIFVTPDGVFKLGDFGISKVMLAAKQDFSRKFTPTYVAPEVYNRQLRDMDFDTAAKADLYSLGLVMYWLANNRQIPFGDCGDLHEALDLRLDGEPLPAPSSVSVPLQYVILKACAYQPELRYGSAKEMLDDLIAIQEGRSIDLRSLPQYQTAKSSPASETNDAVSVIQKDHVPGIGNAVTIAGKKRSKAFKVIVAGAVAVGLIGAAYLAIPMIRNVNTKVNPVADDGMMTVTESVEHDQLPTAPAVTSSLMPAETETAMQASSQDTALAGVPVAVPSSEPTFLPTPSPTLVITDTASIKSIGYQNKLIRTVVTRDRNTGTIVGIRVDAESLDPQHGGLCNDAAFTDQFIGKAGPFTLGADISAVSGATFTSQAIVDAVNALIPTPTPSPTQAVTPTPVDLAVFAVTEPGFNRAPIHVEITYNRINGIIDSVTVDASSHLEDYRKLCEHKSFVGQFTGKRGPFTLGLDIDAVSGATETCQAIIHAINRLYRP